MEMSKGYYVIERINPLSGIHYYVKEVIGMHTAVPTTSLEEAQQFFEENKAVTVCRNLVPGIGWEVSNLGEKS